MAASRNQALRAAEPAQGQFKPSCQNPWASANLNCRNVKTLLLLPCLHSRSTSGRGTGCSRTSVGTMHSLRVRCFLHMPHAATHVGLSLEDATL